MLFRSTVRPDATRLRPPWQGPGRVPWTKSCRIEPQASHRMTLRLSGWDVGTVWRVEGGVRTTVAVAGPGLSFDVRAGTYRVERR